jgi:hypothetical protein
VIEDNEMSALRAAVFQAVGEASVCWKPYPTGAFDSEAAEAVGERLLLKIQRALSAQAAKEQ